MNRSTARYVQALYAAHDALAHENDLDVVTKATARLRRVVPDHPMLPALDAKIARMQIIAGLLDGSLTKSEDDRPQTGSDGR